MPVFTYTTTVRLHLTDAAGILFFGNYFVLAHDAYEAFVTASGFSFRSILEHESFMVPIVHAEGDYKQPLRVSDQITIDVGLDRLGESSYALFYHLKNQEGELVAALKTVHVVVDKHTFQKLPLSPTLREALEKLT